LVAHLVASCVVIHDGRHAAAIASAKIERKGEG
jgi:hypothetical protein